MFNTEVIIDADLTDTGWEIAVRMDAESMEAAWADVADLDEIATGIGQVVVAAILAAHEASVA